MTFYKINIGGQFLHLTYSLYEAELILPHLDAYENMASIDIDEIELIEKKSNDTDYHHSNYFRLDLNLFDSKKEEHLIEIDHKIDVNLLRYEDNNSRFFLDDPEMIEYLDDLDYDGVITYFRGNRLILCWRMQQNKHYTVKSTKTINTVKI